MSMYEELVMDDPKRIERLAMLLAWRTLRRSVGNGRPMSLPNLLRLHRRIAWYQAEHAAAPMIPSWNSGEACLRAGYMAAQPFDATVMPSLEAVLPALRRRGGGRAPNN